MDKIKFTVPPVIKDQRNKPEFPDDFTTIKNLCPMVDKSVEFDWAGLFSAMEEPGGPEKLAAQLADSDRELLANVLGQILRWALAADKIGAIGIRTVALCWLIDPSYFDGGPSCAELSKRFGFKNREYLSKHTANARRKFKIKNRAQDHAHNFKN